MSEKAHKLFSPSASSRWLVCRAEPLVRGLYPETSSSFADEGTTAHWVAEQVLRGKAISVGKVCPETEMKVDSDMLEYTQHFVDYCREVSSKGEVLGVEAAVKAAWIHPDLGGTCDYVARKGKVLHVVDLKYGKGVKVSSVANSQLRIYALAALYEFCRDGNANKFPPSDPRAYDVETVSMSIVQPRLSPEPSAEVMSVELLLKWADEVLVSSIAHTLQLQKNGDLTKGGDHYKPGTHCRFCPHIVNCPAQTKHLIETAKADFMDGALVLPDIAGMDSDKLSEISQLGEQLAAFNKAVLEEIERRISNGTHVPGWKLVASQKNRVWAEGAEETLVRLLGDEAYGPRPLLSPAKAEKIFDSIGIELPEGLAYKPEGSPTLAPASDKRPALAASVEEDFSVAEAKPKNAKARKQKTK